MNTDDSTHKAPRTVEPRQIAPWWPVAVVLSILVVSNVVANLWLLEWMYVPWNILVAIGIVTFALRVDKQSTDDLGLLARKIPTGLRFGGAFALVVLAVYIAAVALPTTRGFFSDDRADQSFNDLLIQLAIVIPFGTVLMEEFIFRGVLPAMFHDRFSSKQRRLYGDLLAALCFGLWHVLPSLSMYSSIPALQDLLGGPAAQFLTVAGSVIATGVAGMFWSWMRNRSSSLAGPIILHYSINAFGLTIAWLTFNPQALG